MSRIEIAGTGLPGGTAIRLDGDDIAKNLRGLTVRLDADSVPSVELDVVVYDFDLEVDQAEVGIPGGTRDLLLRLGWTPPEALIADRPAVQA